MSDSWEKDLGKRLRGRRPSPSSGLINEIVERIPAIAERMPKRRADMPRASFRLALAGALTVALASAVAAVGGVGYASKQVTNAVHAVKSTNSLVPAKSASVQYKGPPVIDGFRSKAACTGERITVFGANFLGATSVTIGGLPARFRVQSDERLTAWVPSGFTGGTIAVTTARGTGTSSNSLKLKHPDC